MKRVEVLTLFPALFGPFLELGLMGRALREGLLSIETVDLRTYGLGRYRVVDDEPYGGGPGMVLRPEPVFAAVREREALHSAAGRPLRRILLTPQGQPFDQAQARRLAACEEVLLFVCGRYEGFDERIRQGLADEELSLGDFVCQGGEVVTMVLLETVARLLPGVLGNPHSPEEESFALGELEYPQYTRPREFEGMRVPEVLLSGNHQAIRHWHREQSRQRTTTRRPELTLRKKTGPLKHTGAEAEIKTGIE